MAKARKKTPKTSRTPVKRTKKKMAGSRMINIAKGTLIIIGGSEDRENDMTILQRVADSAHHGPLVVATLASQFPEDLWHSYQKVFHRLGVKEVRHLHLENAEQARHPENIEIVEGAKTIFFSGGDQLRITTKIGGTPIGETIREIYRGGGTIAGTSAGASVMGETMLVGSENQETHKVGNWMMAPGLGLVPNMIIDQHFAERGRIGRLLGAVSLNPAVLGVGIDEDTSILIRDNKMTVLGKNAVYVVDAQEVTYTNISEAAADKTMSMHNVKVHILAEKDSFDLIMRMPFAPQPEV